MDVGVDVLVLMRSPPLTVAAVCGVLETVVDVVSGREGYVRGGLVVG